MLVLELCDVCFLSGKEASLIFPRSAFKIRSFLLPLVSFCVNFLSLDDTDQQK